MREEDGEFQEVAPVPRKGLRHGTERDHDIAATLDAIRMLVEAQV